jgi:hypothetical protein
MLRIIFAKDIHIPTREPFFYLSRKGMPPAHSSGSRSSMVNISKIISNIDYDATELHVTVPRKSRHAYYDSTMVMSQYLNI